MGVRVNTNNEAGNYTSIGRFSFILTFSINIFILTSQCPFEFLHIVILLCYAVHECLPKTLSQNLSYLLNTCSAWPPS